MIDPKKHFAEKCEQIARQELANRGWGLVRDWSSFIEEVINEAEERLKQGRRRLSEKKIISNATVNRYAHLWHRACGADGTFWQHQAFEELEVYLYRAVYYECQNPDLAEESAQMALFQVWKKLKNVKDPGCFPRWTEVIARREFFKLVRREEWMPLLPDKESEEKETDEPSATHTKHPTGSLVISESDDMLQELEKVIRSCLRSTSRQTVIFENLFKDKTPSQIAKILHKSLDAVYSLKSKAILQLRKCENLLTFAKNIGMSIKHERS